MTCVLLCKNHRVCITDRHSLFQMQSRGDEIAAARQDYGQREA